MRYGYHPKSRGTSIRHAINLTLRGCLPSAQRKYYFADIDRGCGDQNLCSSSFGVIHGGVLPDPWTKVKLGFPQLEENRMKKSGFTYEQIVVALRDAEATTVAAAARKHGVSEQSIHRWRKQFDGMQVSDVRELRRLRDENA